MDHTKAERRERGQSMVEFALVLPVVLLLIFGLLEFGRVINAEITAGHCANELARFGTVQTGNTATIEGKIRTYAYSSTNPVCPTFNLSNSSLNITVGVTYPSTASVGAGKAVTVAIAYPVNIVTPIIKGFFRPSPRCPDPPYPTGTYCAHGTATLQMEAAITP